MDGPQRGQLMCAKEPKTTAPPLAICPVYSDDSGSKQSSSFAATFKSSLMGEDLDKELLLLSPDLPFCPEIH